MAGSISLGRPQSYQMLMTSFQTALSNTLYDRCIALNQLIQDAPLKDLQYIFPSLVECVFGFRSNVDWGLLTLEKDLQSREFECLRKFLGPDGPILRLVYKFTEEFTPKFEFPIASLPFPSQVLMQEGKVPPLYVNKLQILNPGMFPSVLQLNALEFYFFHFTYLIVNPYLKNTLSTVNQQDTLYAHLLEEYLHSFLPSDSKAVPLFQQSSGVQHSPILTSSLSANYGSPSVLDSLHSPSPNPPRPSLFTPVKEKPSLLKKGTVMMVQANSPHGISTTQAESWRSETFILILKEMLLNQNSLEQQKGPLLHLKKAFVPTHYHVWMVRIMVKHLHFFYNSSLTPNQATGHGQIMIDSLGRLKSLGMTQLLQKEMYCFLKSTFDQWPLDASFRVPLETYLSYIQPGRYVNNNFESSVWHKFMSENLFFYTTIFQQILKRFLRMDLSCPKNAYMLFRLTKVVCTKELREMIMQAESSGLSKPSNLSFSSSFVQRSPEKYSFRKAPHNEMALSSYMPLFCEPVFMLVSELLSTIQTARSKTTVSSPLSQSGRSIFSKVCSFFDMSHDGMASDDNSPAEAHKTAQYLESSASNLCFFFKEVSPPPICNDVFSPSLPPTTPISQRSSAGDHLLSPGDRHQLMQGKGKVKLLDVGDPDLQPVRTYEVGCVVHFMNDLSQWINEKYSTQIHHYYHQESFLGRLSRRLLASPATYYEVNKFPDMRQAQWIPKHLPPRVNLRCLANRSLIAYFLFFLFVAYCFGKVFQGLFYLLVALVVLWCISAVLYPVPIKRKTD